MIRNTSSFSLNLWARVSRSVLGEGFLTSPFSKKKSCCSVTEIFYTLLMAFVDYGPSFLLFLASRVSAYDAREHW